MKHWNSVLGKSITFPFNKNFLKRYLIYIQKVWLTLLLVTISQSRQNELFTFPWTHFAH